MNKKKILINTNFLINTEILNKTEQFILKNSLNVDSKDIVLRRCFNEAWFSDTIAWLLNPKGSHNLGVAFANEFLKSIAIERSSKKNDYKNRKSMFKWGKSGKGTAVTKLSLKNASSIREFYLASSIKKRSSRGARYCDIVFIDLDLKDGLFLVIENKLFTSNHPSQLEDYYQIIEEKYERTKIREYVYLTLTGKKPIEYEKTNSKTKLIKNWVNLSWNKDILEIINKVQGDKDPHSEIVVLKNILKWLNKLNKESILPLIEELRKLLLKTVSVCILDELQRLGEGKTGNWKEGNEKTNHISIIHTSSPKKTLYVELLPNFTITIQSRNSRQPLFEKIIIPFGINPDQIFNFIDIAARNIYHYHFGDSTNLYLSGKRRLRITHSEIKKVTRHIFSFVYKYQYELRILLASSNYVWEADQFENEEIYKVINENE